MPPVWGNFNTANSTTDDTANHYFVGSSAGAWTFCTVEILEIEQQVEEARQQAVEAAEVLLREHLGEARLEEYRRTGAISVFSPSRAGRRYVVDAYSRIKVYEGERLVDQLCVNLVDGGMVDSFWLPAPDVVLGKVWLLEHVEDRVLAVANHNGMPIPPG